jgi:hypothetical protein
MRLIFNDVSEFLGELSFDRGVVRVQRNIVRVTIKRKTETNLPIVHYTLLAMYRTPYELVELNLYTGPAMQGVHQEGDGSELAIKERDKLIKELEHKGHEVRSGYFDF